MFKLKKSEQDERYVRLVSIARGNDAEGKTARVSAYQCRCTQAKTDPAIVCRPHFMLGFLAEGRH